MRSLRYATMFRLAGLSMDGSVVKPVGMCHEG